MPIGSYAAIPALVQTLLEHRPRSVLDLGMGFGGGGMIVREWLDQGVRPWQTFLAGVEVWPEYRNPVWDLYNIVYAQSIESFCSTNGDVFECVLLCDVLEHFERAAGQRLLAAIKSRVAAAGRLLVTTPATFFPQGAVNGNPHERHRSLWSVADLVQFGFRTSVVGQTTLFCGESLFAEWRG